MNNLCPCGSKLEYSACCEPLLTGKSKAKTAEELMRSRYTAYVKKNVDYLFNTLHPNSRTDFDAKATLEWAENSNWQRLEILKTDANTVEFVACYLNNGKSQKHHETALFKKEDGVWYYVDAVKPENKPFVRAAVKTGRNDPCPCGSGKKYKHCCAIK